MKNSHSETKGKNENQAFIFALQMNFCATLVGHPIDVLKTIRQIQVKKKSYPQIALNQWQNQGIKGFYPGFLPNLLRQSTKAGSRTWSMQYITSFYNEIKLFSTFVYSFLCGNTIAIPENTLQTILDKGRITAEAESYKQMKHEHYWKTLSNKPLHSWSIGYIKTSLAWTNFFFIREKLKEKGKNNNQNTNSFTWLLLISGATSFTKILLTNPFDIIRSNMIANKFNTITAIKNLYKKNGFKTFFIGSGARYVHGLISSGIGNLVLNHLEDDKHSHKIK